MTRDGILQRLRAASRHIRNERVNRPIRQIWKSNWRSVDGDTQKVQMQIGHSVHGYHAGLRVDRGNKVPIGGWDTKPFTNIEHAFDCTRHACNTWLADREAALKEFRQGMPAQADTRLDAPGNLRDLFAEWRQDEVMAKERDAMGIEPPARPVPEVTPDSADILKLDAPRNPEEEQAMFKALEEELRQDAQKAAMDGTKTTLRYLGNPSRGW